MDLFLEKGANIMLPPDYIQDRPDYRSTPLSISAAIAGDYSILKKVISLGGSL